MIDRQAYAKTLKEQAHSTARILGCSDSDFEFVWGKMLGYQLPLTPRSFVYQVANAMEESGLVVKESAISTATARL